MSNELTGAAASWLAGYLNIELPEDQLNAAVATTSRASLAVGARTKALAMEDEPASFLAALERLAGPKR